MAASTPNDAAAPSRPLDVLLTLNDDEKSFGMSLAQVTSSGGVKWTVISSVFANSAADRAGVCKGFFGSCSVECSNRSCVPWMESVGYVVRCINDVAMEDKPVAYVASHFRKVRQAKLTLDVGESGGTCNTSTTRGKGGKVTTPSAFDRGHDQGQTVSSKGKAVVLSGKAIAAPGSALAVSNDAAPKQPISKLGAKAAAKSLQMQPRSKGGSPASINGASTRGKKDAGALPSAVGNTEKDMGVVNRTQEVVPRLQRSREQVETETSSSHEGMTITHPEAKTEHCSKGTKNRPRWHEVVSSTKEGTG
ncbi:hypothetical protein PsorP6_000627 [Peronosclerospora sorghi]|uniref:Uncharacterized protein n=1 Tax=Peronosclerospora sorghi TaxID=230839 RepID=A0ACC0WVL4_9STRA|nr:hypothetical protein PsorP6_000627 [Peronosclerospora sorghi]